MVGGQSTRQLEGFPDVAAMESFKNTWDDEWRGHLAAKALEVLKARTPPLQVQVFYLHVIKGQSSAAVARALEIQRAQVYLIKFRLLPRFRRIIRRLEAELG